MDWTNGCNDEGDGSFASGLVNLETMLNMASLGVALFTTRQEKKHHLEAKKMEENHHRIALDLERKQMALDLRSVKADKKRHAESVKLTGDLHKQTIKLEQKLHQVSLCAALEQHLQDITSDLIVAGKEADRDMWDQRNAQYQTLLLAATVMFAAGMAVIVEGELPDDSNTVVIIGYSASVGMAFAFLFVSIILCIKTVVAMSRFMYRLTNKHQTVVTNLVLKATNVMDQLFKMQEDFTTGGGKCRERPPSRPPPVSAETSGVPGGVSTMTSSSGVVNKDSKKKSEDYEDLLKKLSSKRREINRYLTRHYLNRRLVTDDRIIRQPKAFKASRRASIMRNPKEEKAGAFGRKCSHNSQKTVYVDQKVAAATPAHMETEVVSMTEFEAFWHQNLKIPARFAMMSFYIGTGCLLCAISFLIFARFTLTLKSPAGAYTFLSFVGVSLALGLVVAFLPGPRKENDEAYYDTTKPERFESRIESFANNMQTPDGGLQLPNRSLGFSRVNSHRTLRDERGVPVAGEIKRSQ
mmetsp:Transcript_16060/g.22542  ORF Transcript_16060/g.22542 Transcript_16060/m.22542 type:complete len:524 (+) Transcript_16060:131-1702(+)|eukprot:CAMPEP_0185262020 /NCGR_PEP_ID=MMETSP1359-20130426/10272_1 /TAXON_ID=552665 /ORGANISM="Bigelowiella longifila, Strain CCMP242" /LENGTH=523 /DNA_ID=CAMNT_0027848829 /DNA_START=122 /DNA_END=1693 /DNA_ORIENTATION=+